jgi:hypothetical protein
MAKLKVNPEPQFTAEVGISVPGVKYPVIVKITFKYMDRDQYFKYTEDHKDDKVETILEDLIVDWSGFDEEYSVDALRSVFKNYPSTSTQMFETYTTELFVSKVKN